MPSFCAPTKMLLLLPPEQLSPSLSAWMVPGIDSPEVVMAPRTWMNVPEPPPLLPARRVGQPVRFSRSIAGALFPGTVLTRPTLRMLVVRFAGGSRCCPSRACGSGRW